MRGPPSGNGDLLTSIRHLVSPGSEVKMGSRQASNCPTSAAPACSLSRSQHLVKRIKPPKKAKA